MRILKWTPIVAALALTACAQPPTAEINGAKAALETARASQAADYAPASWNAANDLSARLQAELDAQADKAAVLRSYGTAKQLAADVTSAAEQAAQESVLGKEAAKTDAEAMMTKARDARARADKALAGAPRGKGTEADLASLRSDAAGADSSIEEMQRAFDAGEYLSAKSKAEAIIAACEGVVKQIESAQAQRHQA
jgi:hypothetical protein